MLYGFVAFLDEEDFAKNIKISKKLLTNIKTCDIVKLQEGVSLVACLFNVF